MATKSDNEKLLYCSFCGKSQHEVKKLIAGPSVFICDECVDLCNDIIKEEVKSPSKEAKDHDQLPTPKEILFLKEKLNQILATHTGQTLKKIAADTDRDNFLSAEQSVEYGMVDQVISKRSQVT